MSSLIKGTIKKRLKIIVTIIIAPNHLNTFVPTNKSNTAIIPLAIFASRIADKLLFHHNEIASFPWAHFFFSSFTLSYTNIFASTHVPILSNIAASPLSDKGYPMSLTTANNNIKKNESVIIPTNA